MARYTEFLPAKDIDFGWLPKYQSTGRSFKSALRPGQWVAGVPILANVPDTNYLQMGLTHLIQNVGQDNGHLPVIQQACMQNANFLIGYINKPWGQWTESDVRSAVTANANQRHGGYAFYLGQIMEAIANAGVCGTDEWRNSQQHRWTWQQIQIECDKIGGRAYGDYDGHLRLLRFDNYASPNDFRQAMRNDNDALTLAKSASPFGDEFYTGEGWRYRHGNIKVYQTGDIDAHKVVNSFLVGMKIDIRARRAVGTNRRVCITPFNGYDETLGNDPYSCTYERNVPVGGTAICNTFPMWSYVHQMWLEFNALLDDFDLYNWQAEQRYGTDPNVVPNQTIGQFGEVIFGYNGPAQRAGTSYYYNTGAVGFPISPLGSEDIYPTAGEMLKFVADNAGSYERQYVPHRVNGSALSTTPDDYLIDRYYDRMGEAILIGSGSQRVLAFCATGWESGSTKQVSVPMPSGAACEFTAFAHVPKLIHIDLTQN